MTLNPEYPELIELVREMQARDRCFDLLMARKLGSLLRSHNLMMEQALKGHRECEKAVADTLDALEPIR